MDAMKGSGLSKGFIFEPRRDGTKGVIPADRKISNRKQASQRRYRPEPDSVTRKRGTFETGAILRLTGHSESQLKPGKSDINQGRGILIAIISPMRSNSLKV